MSSLPDTRERNISQLPAIEQLINMGYKFLSRKENVKARGGNLNSVILEEILEEQLKKINSYEYKGKAYKFSDKSIKDAVRELKEYPINDGFMKSNECIYDLITLGKSFNEDPEGEGISKSFSLKYIDFNNIYKNIFHVTEEFAVKGKDGETTDNRRPDIVLFVNGIPLVVMECKSSDVSIDEAIKDLTDKQKDNEIPQLFIYSQILIAINSRRAEYATTRTIRKFYGIWREEEFEENEVKESIHKKLDKEIGGKLIVSGDEKYEPVKNRLITEQDKLIYSILRKDRLLELIKYFLVYDDGIKKIARYQQYFGIKETLSRVKNFNEQGNRKGGVIWHTQGSGKSLTMVMLSKSLALDNAIEDPRVFIVTDRVDLDKQIHETFSHCGIEAKRAMSGRKLSNLIDESKNKIITTGIKKFEIIADKTPKFADGNKNIFVLVDESHRSQYGLTNSKMKKVIPNACYIGFTGTPLKKDEKDTAKKFGGFIHEYKIKQAVKDKAVLPLIYEGRHVKQEVNVDELESTFEKSLLGCTEKVKRELTLKYSQLKKIKSTETRMLLIVYDIYQNYTKKLKGTKFKAMFATSSKPDAIKYKELFNELEGIKTEVVISPPGKNDEGEDIPLEKEKELEKIEAFWEKMMNKYKTEKNYNDSIRGSFKAGTGCDILIVVDKLLTGFDAPIASVLYIDKPLKEHNLLQAIARVNRLEDDKEYGYIIDYYGLIKDLDKALKGQDALSDFDPNDIEDVLRSTSDQINELKSARSEIKKMFIYVNINDNEACEQSLEDLERREKFYSLVSKFSKTFAFCLSTDDFYNKFDYEIISEYKDELKFYQKLKDSVKKRYSDNIDISGYDTEVKKLLDTYVTSSEIVQVVKPVNVFEEEFIKEVDELETYNSKADTIASRLIKSVEEIIKEDVFYEDFAERVRNKIDEWKKRRKKEGEHFNSKDYYEDMESELNIAKNRHENKQDNIPKGLKDYPELLPFYDLLKKNINDDEIVIEMSKEIDSIILNHNIVGWKQKQEAQNNMINDIEDYLFDLKGNNKIDVSVDTIDIIIEKIIDLAKNRERYDN
ncbi:type I restriction endonuclease subunit R [Clostridium botulinum]|uniref:Type I restriction enzyme endonuclease subunit n=1 Tax=Clostridium botulinum TaxID=1491 RepID=A0A6M0V3C6_CLOBO|nr:HsdR family type I site-specific deoxyribonuclease [Clostridium botulinum]MCS6112585.1 type I restriction endonuclease subunit R [Clostridium botulinum]NFE13094.1 type I restriction endonuclease subunit R [Clostridium botulinum]NFE61236.1 type I restriction endonuclease subunit R [Clostridium botulinum]NFF87295.1 type I restriction endonuclease subunit R [Clostridium botulinum]NFG11344.1 type I restriction endonuclease subunit R [Clostridium botulinum]